MEGHFLTIDSHDEHFEYIFMHFGIRKSQIEKLYKIMNGTSITGLTIYYDAMHVQISNFDPLLLKEDNELIELSEMLNIKERHIQYTTYGRLIFRPFESFLEIPLEILELMHRDVAQSG